jgi:hypothetical protein
MNLGLRKVLGALTQANNLPRTTLRSFRPEQSASINVETALLKATAKQ